MTFKMFEFISRWFKRIEPDDIKDSPPKQDSSRNVAASSSSTQTSTKIGQGSYGCVYRPAMPCNGQVRKGAVSKAMLERHADTEFTNTRMISLIDTKHIFHYPIIDRCKISWPWDCDKPVNHQLVYEDGGVALTKHINREASTLPEEFIYGLWRLFVGLYALHNNGVYHFDIKPDNIVVKEVDDVYIIKYIDFGMAKNVNDIMFGGVHGWKWYFNYPWYPVETLFLNYGVLKLAEQTFNEKDTFKRLDIFLDLIEEKYKITDLIETRAKLRVRATGEDLDSVIAYMRTNVSIILLMYNLIYNNSPVSAQVKLLRFIYTRIDVYSLGITLLQSRHLLPQISVLASRMCEIDIRNRIGPCRSLIEFLSICQQLGYKYLNKIRKLGDDMVPADRLHRIGDCMKSQNEID